MKLSPLCASAWASSRPETELLLACAKPSIDSTTSAQIEDLLTEQIDWEYLLRIATQHGIMPLLYQRLQSLHAEAVDQSALGHLRERFRGNAYRNLFLAEELCRVLRLLEGHGIEPDARVVLARGDVHDPDLNRMSITVGEVRTSPDLRVATVYVLPLGGRDAETALDLLARNKGELRRVVSKKLALKFAPDLRFQLDETFDRLDESRRLFAQDAVRRDLES